MKRPILLTAFLVTSIFNIYSSKAQDYTFSQFYEQPLLRNPALAGLFTGDLRVSMSYRDQWGSVTVPYRTTSLSIEHKIPVGTSHDLLTISSQMSVDGAGDIRLKRTQILPGIAFHKSLSEENDTYLTAAFMSGPVSSQFDATQLKMGDQFRNGSYDASNPTSQRITNTGYSYWDVNAGLSFSSTIKNKTNYYVAVGMTHITNPTIKSVTGNADGFISPKISFNAGINAPSGDRGHITAFTDMFIQNGNRQLLCGVMYGINLIDYDNGDPDILYVGSFMRFGDAVIPVVKLGLNHFTIGVSYDVNISSLNVASNWRGGLEMSITYHDFLKIRNSTLDKLRCTKF